MKQGFYGAYIPQGSTLDSKGIACAIADNMGGCANAKEASNRSDIYSPGILVYILLTVQLPYGEKMSRNLNWCTLNKTEYQPSIIHNPMIPLWMDGAIHKAVKKDQRSRYSTFSEYFFDLTHPKGLSMNNLNILTALAGALRRCRSLAGNGHAARPAPCSTSRQHAHNCPGYSWTAPNPIFMRRSAPLLENNPVLFWQDVCAILLAANPGWLLPFFS